MAHLVPVARWFGFGFGYAVAEAVTAVALDYQGAGMLVPDVLLVLNVTLALIASCALIRTLFRAWADRREAPLGTYAKSSGHDRAALGRASKGQG